MADTEDADMALPASSEMDDDVLVNGDSEDDKGGGKLLHPDYNTNPEDPAIPRRSSLVKDASRRQQRKKTVSFSSMPNEKTVVNGKLPLCFCRSKTVCHLHEDVEI